MFLLSALMVLWGSFVRNVSPLSNSMDWRRISEPYNTTKDTQSQDYKATLGGNVSFTHCESLQTYGGYITGNWPQNRKELVFIDQRVRV